MMKLISKFTIVSLLPLCVSGSLFAAEIVGEGTVDGTRVFLFDDGTWSTSDQSAAAVAVECPPGGTFVSRRVPVSLCFDPAVWQAVRVVGQFERTLRTHDGTFYAGVVTEGQPAELATLRAAILSNAAKSGTIDSNSIRDSWRAQAPGGVALEVIEFAVDIQDTPFRVLNAYAQVEGKGTLQVTFWAASNVFRQNEAAGESVLKSVRVQ